MDFFRTLWPSKEEGSRGGYGFFCKLRKRFEKRGDKIPVQALQFLRIKVAEQKSRTYVNDSYFSGDNEYKLTSNENDNKYTLSVRSGQNTTPNTYIMSHEDLELLANCLSVVNLLSSSQPSRTPGEYPNFLIKLQEWATAKRAYEEVLTLLTPGQKIESQAHFDTLAHRVRSEMYPDFIERLEALGIQIRQRLGIVHPNMSMYEAAMVSRGFNYSWPTNMFEPVMHLVQIVHESSWKGSAYETDTE